MATFSSRSTSKRPSRIIRMTGACGERSGSSLVSLHCMARALRGSCAHVLVQVHLKAAQHSHQDDRSLQRAQ